jgi:parallel beta-helix repeat protein
MNRKFVLALALTLLVGTLTVASNIQKAYASGTIYIRSDGSIDPPGAPISTVDNVTYTLTGNITSDSHGIVVLRSNIIIDGAGYTLQCIGALSTGIDVESGSNVTIKNAKIKGFDSGISFFGNTPALKFSKVVGNYIVNCSYGILGGGFSYNIAGNSIINNTWGVKLFASSNNTIVGNNITANDKGITLWGGSSNNSVFGNNIESNFYGITLIYGSSNNKILHNNFINNTRQADSVGYNNTWDEGYPSGGNYWSDYTGMDSDGDGVGDTPYAIDADNQDRYPLMYPWSPLPVHNINTGLGYAAIQEAINAQETLDGHTIFVEAGTYYENVVVNKSLTLIGEKSNDTIIDGNETGTVIIVEGDCVTINNFTIRNSKRYDGPPEYGIYLNCSFNTNISNNIITDHWFGVYSYDSLHLKIANNLMFDNNNGIHLYDSFNSTIADNNINSDEYGIRLEMSNNTDIKGNFLFDNPIGILIHEQSWNSKVISNVISNSTENGLELIGSGNSIISNNLIADNARNGIYLFEYTRATIVNNNLTNNGENGIYLIDSGDNIVYHNNFIANTQQANGVSSANVWDDGYPSGGNYWSDYNGYDSNNDGIGDTSYFIDENNTDHYPLMVPYVIPEFPSFLILPLFMIATLLAVIVYRRKQADRR